MEDEDRWKRGRMRSVASEVGGGLTGQSRRRRQSRTIEGEGPVAV